MEEKKKTITSSDKIPGCERLTRPEEIKGLSKYLGAIKETQEDWIEDNMPDERGKLEIEVDQIDKLPKSKIGIRPSDLESLPDAVIGLDDDSKVKLPKESDKLHDIPETKIIPDISRLKVDNNEKLPKDKERLGGEDKKVELPKDKLRIENDREPQELPDSVLGISDREDVKLPKSRIGIGDVIDEISELPNSVLGVDDDRKISLPKDKENIWPEEIKNLPKNKDGVPGEIDDPKLPGEKDIRPGEEKDIKIPAGVEYIYPADPNALPKTKIKRGSEDREIELPGDTIKPTAAISDVPSLPEILSKPEISPEDIDNYVKARKNDELYTDIIDTLTLEENGKINDGNIKLAGLLSALLGKDEMTENQIKGAAQSLFQYFQTTKALINSAIIEPKLPDKFPDRQGYVIPERSGVGYADYASPNTFLRYLAEIATYGTSGKGWFGKDNSGWSGYARRTLLDTTLKALVATRRWTEKKLGINRDKLPYDQGNIAEKKDIMRQTLEKVSKTGKYRPNMGTLPGEKGKGLLETTGRIVGGIGEAVNIAKNIKTGRNIVADGIGTLVRSIRDAQSVGNNNETPKNEPSKVQYLVGEENATIHDLNKDNRFFLGTGLGITIEDLCRGDGSEISTIDKLKEALKNSPYTTTPRKYIKSLGAKNNATLDTNAYWEVIIEPLCDKDLNGGWSFLPSIHEINLENVIEHGYRTHYDKWIPLSNIELQKSKLTSKTLGLYDGEISYPVSVEYTNELRMTVIDDQYKSWRRYFQKVSDVSVYSSEAHSVKWYQERSKDSSHLVRPTAIDKSKFCIAYYKNLTFRIRLYFMTPQYSTIKKFDLLCVMKDFSEEYYGDIDAGSQDLNISFSIVGENPKDNNLMYIINSNGVGSWAYKTGKDVEKLGSDMDSSIQASEVIRSKNEDQAAQENKDNGDQQRKDPGGKSGGTGHQDPDQGSSSSTQKPDPVYVEKTYVAQDTKDFYDYPWQAEKMTFKDGVANISDLICI